MPIEFACGCGKSFKVADEYAGKRSKCTACGQPVVVPTLAPMPSVDPTDEDAAFRALSEGADPEPIPRTTGGYAPLAPRRAEPPLSERDTAHDMARRTTEWSKPSKQQAPPPPSYRSNSEPTAKRKPSPNWMKVGIGVAMAVGGIVWIVVAWAAGYIFPYPIALVLASPFFLIDGFRDRSKK